MNESSDNSSLAAYLLILVMMAVPLSAFVFVYWPTGSLLFLVATCALFGIVHHFWKRHRQSAA